MGPLFSFVDHNNFKFVAFHFILFYISNDDE